MKRSAVERFRKRLQAGEAVYGCWVTLEAPAVSEIAVGLGFDWIAVDADHDRLDWSDLSEHVRAAVRSETVVFIKMSNTNDHSIERAMNIGADGVIAGNVTTLDQVEKFASKMPRTSDTRPLVVLTIESSQLEQLPNAVALKSQGVDALFAVPPAKTAVTDALVDEAPDRDFLDVIRKWDVPLGAMISDERQISVLEERGFQMLCLGVDRRTIFDELTASIQSAGVL